MEHLSIESLGVDVERGPDIAVAELRLHVGRVCLLLAMGGKATPQASTPNRIVWRKFVENSEGACSAQNQDITKQCLFLALR